MLSTAAQRLAGYAANLAMSPSVWLVAQRLAGVHKATVPQFTVSVPARIRVCVRAGEKLVKEKEKEKESFGEKLNNKFIFRHLSGICTIFS